MKNGYSQLRVRKEQHTDCRVCPIRNLALFEAARDDLLDWAQKFRSQQYALDARRLLYREGEIVEESYTLFHGWVMLYKMLPDGKRQVLRIALPGDFLGSRGSGGVPIDHSAIAITECVLCGFPEERLSQLFRERPEIVAKLVSIQRRDMTQCHQHIMNVAQKSAIESIACMLIDLYDRCLERNMVVKPETFYIPLSQEEIADYAGITLVHVSRVIKELRDQGVLDNGHRKIHVLDPGVLRRITDISSREENESAAES